MPAQGQPATPAQVAAGLLSLALVLGILLAWAWAFGRALRRRPLLPEAPARRVPWGLLSVVGVVLLFVVVQSLIVVADAPGIMGRGGDFTAYDQLKITAETNAAMLLLVPLLLRLTSRARLADLGLAGVPVGRNLWRGIIACLLMTAPVYGVMAMATQVWTYQQHPLMEMLRDDPTGATAVLAVVAAVLLAPAAEELVFRVVLQGALTRVAARLLRRSSPIADDPGVPEVVIEPAAAGPDADRASPWSAPSSPIEPEGRTAERVGGLAAGLANVATSVLFAGIHFPQWPAPLPLFLLSLGLGLLYARTRSFYAPFALHASFNGISTAALLFLTFSGAPARPAPPPPPAEHEGGAHARMSEFHNNPIERGLGNAAAIRYDSLPPSPHDPRWSEDRGPADRRFRVASSLADRRRGALKLRVGPGR